VCIRWTIKCSTHLDPRERDRLEAQEIKFIRTVVSVQKLPLNVREYTATGRNQCSKEYSQRLPHTTLTWNIQKIHVFPEIEQK